MSKLKKKYKVSYLNTSGLLICQGEPGFPVDLHQARHADKPLVIEGEPNVHRLVVPEKVIPLVHVNAGYLVCDDLVEEMFLWSSALEYSVRAWEGAVNQLLDEDKIQVSEIIGHEYRPKIVLLDKKDFKCNLKFKYFIIQL